MAYSRKNLKKVLSIADAIDSLLYTKEPMLAAVKYWTEQASDCIAMAMALMQIEAADFAEAKKTAMEKSPIFPQLVDEEKVEGIHWKCRSVVVMNEV